MPIQARDFYGVADLLRKGAIVPPSEACSRTVVGRAYYAAFLALRDAVRTAYGDPKADIDHSELRRGLAAAPDTDVADAGTRLKTLWTTRRLADYDLGASLTPLVAQLMLANASAILSVAPSLIGKIPRGLRLK